MAEDLLSQSTGDLTSVASDESFMVFHDAQMKLEQYLPTDPNDDTVSVLHAFIDHLPEDRKLNILHSIRSSETDVIKGICKRSHSVPFIPNEITSEDPFCHFDSY